MTSREKLWLRADRERAGYRKSMRPVFLSALNNQVKPLLEIVGQANDVRDILLPAVVDVSVAEEAYKTLYLTVVPAFAIAKRNKYKNTKSNDEVFDDLIKDRTRSYLRNHSGETITAMGDTTLDYVRNTVRRLTTTVLDMNLSASEGVTMLRDMLQSEWHRAARFRVERIVRTEVNRASNFGSLEGMQSLNIPMRKVWLSAFTEKSRPEHMDADGQKVNLNDPFEVGGEFLQYPGDPKGSASNTINCLCTQYEELI